MKICQLHPGAIWKYGRCPECHKAYKREYQKKHRTKYSAERKAWRDRNLAREQAKTREYFKKNPDKAKTVSLSRNNFTLTLYKTALEIQQGKCAICQRELERLPKHQIHADHCHETGVPRGVLCGLCNVGLGAFKESHLNLARAIRYLNSSPLNPGTA